MDLNSNDQAVAYRQHADLLKFSAGNGKLDGAIHHFSLPAGWACPGARHCLSRAVKQDGGNWKVVDGDEVSYRCFSASEEARYPNVRAARWHNFGLLKAAADTADTTDGKAAAMASLILASLPVRRTPFDGLSVGGATYKLVVRLHVGGDFFSQASFDAWLIVAARRPDVLFYGYTKSLSFWVRRLDSMTANFVLTASEGGRHDHLINEHGLRFARVVYSEAEAEAAGLSIDTDDSHAMRRGPSFALLLHGPQPKGTPAAKALSELRAAGEWGHGRLAARLRREASRPVALPVVG